MKNKVQTKLHEKILNYISILLIVFIILNVSINFLYWSDGWTEMFWYCDFAAILLSLGILFKKNYLISSVLITAIPAQFFWILDFILHVFGFEGFGRTAWLFSWPVLSALPSVLVHIILIPLAFYATVIYGFNKKGVFIGFLMMAFAMVMPFYLSAQDDNINCVFYSCDVDFEHSATYSYLGMAAYSLDYLLFITLRWFFWILVVHFCLLFIFRRLFKRVKIS